MGWRPEVGATSAQRARASRVTSVFVGGCLGTACRSAASDLIPPVGLLPTATLVVNVLASLLLGLLLEYLVRTGDDAGVRQLVRLGVGTGFCGSLSTYGTFMVETELLLTSDLGIGLCYLAISAVLGVMAAFIGAGAARRLSEGRES